MAKETVEIVFSAKSEQVQALYAEMSKGNDKLVEKTRRASTEVRGLSNAFGDMGSVIERGKAALSAWNMVLDQTIAKRKEFNRLNREDAEGSQMLAVEGGLSAADERAVNAAIDRVTIGRAAPNRQFVTQVANELLQVGMAPNQITGGGLESGVKILQAFNSTSNGNGSQLMRMLVANMQNLGIPVNPQNMEGAAVQFNEIKQLSGLEFDQASRILENMARVSKSPRSVKALGGIGLTPEQIDPARVGIPDAMKNLFDKTAGMPENTRNAMFARLFGDNEANGLARMFARRGEIVGGDRAGFERDARRASTGSAAAARAAESRARAAESAQGSVDFETTLQNMRAYETNSGTNPYLIDIRQWMFRAGAEILGEDRMKMGIERTMREVPLPQKIELHLPNKTRVPGIIKATENMEGMLKSAAGVGGRLG